MKTMILIVLAVISLIGCGKESPINPEYATAAKPVELCISGTPRGSWYCEQSTLTVMISANSDGNYVAYPIGSYSAAHVGVSCSINISTVKTMDGNTTCYITQTN